jgi:hypothetical protein
MATTHLASSTRQVGDMSIILPTGNKGWYESARDGSIFPATDKYFICYETSQNVMNRAGVAIADSNPRPIAFNRATNSTQNSLLFTFAGGAGNPFVLHGVYNYIANTLRNTATRGWNTTDPYNFRCGPCQRVGLFVDGANFTLITCYADASGSQGYYAHAVTTAIFNTMSIPSILSTTGSLLVGRQHATDTAARSTFIAGLFMGSAMSGVTFTDLGLNTDAGKLRLLVDPHGKLSEISSGIENRRSFDRCNSFGQRVITEGNIAVGDKLVCIHSGAELTFQQDASPTATAEGREAYAPLSQRFEHRTSVASEPHVRQVGAVMFSGGHYANGSNFMENAIDRRDPGTGYRIAPSIILPPIYRREDSTTGAPISGGVYYQSVTPTIPSESHQDIGLAYDPTGDRLVVKVGYHSDYTAAGVPTAGQRLLDVGGLWILRDGALPKPSTFNVAAEESSERTCSYGSMTVADDGKVYIAVRARDTTFGKMRFCEVASDDSNTIATLTTTPNNAIDAGYPVDMMTLDDGTLLACYAVRANGAQGFIGPAVVAIDPANFASSVTGWWGTRTGENLATYKPNLPWFRPSLFPIPCPARTAIDLYGANATLPDAGEWDYDLQPPVGCFYKHTEGGVQFVGILCGEHDDPTRGGATYTPESSGNNRETGLKLHVHAWDGATHTLRYLRSIDLFPAKKHAAAGRAAASTIEGNRDFNYTLSPPLVTRGARAMIAVYRSDGVNYAADAVGYATAGLGKSIGVIDVQDWHKPTYTVDGYGPIVEASEYGAATMQVRPLSGMTIELLLTNTGAPSSLIGGGQSSCFTRYMNIGLTRLLPAIENRQPHNGFAV